MNSYPPELLAQLAPVMFVAGLEPANTPNTQPEAPKPQDAFATLSLRLREAFLSQRKPAIWYSEKSKTFQIIPVDKAVRFPPRKLAPQGDDPTNPVAHSPLSPLTPSSPLYPDGLIAPIWIRKHTSLVPSVFVLFLRLFELPLHAPRSPLDHPDAEREREREQEERRRDTELSAEIAARKRSTNERGIKLTVVLMASRRMLDDPSLDGRLTYIRRQSGLDSRAALFVLSPVSVAELNDFVRSLQDALYEAAVEYYTNHSKRVRRKRNRHSQAISSYTPLPGQNRLRAEGWTVRYEYKMACFAEFRSEDEVALKHYQDAYSTLVIMFGSTAILPPRTKRWAEAKVLVDSINVKICKLYLYNNEHALALSHHSTHMRRFADFSRGWGIGEETFEYWSWMARQHRVLAELLEQGSRSSLMIPSHQPTPSAAASATARGGLMEVDSMQVPGLNPAHALQHPGFYYYMAARCTEQRRERFLAVVPAEAAHGSSAPGFINERKVDHLTIILELYTKSYELFKKYSPVNSQNTNQGRLTLWIAYRIAETYYESGKYDMAVKFFERIAKTYRREKWSWMLRPLLVSWYACAKEIDAVDLSAKLLLEMISYGARLDDDGPEKLSVEFLHLLQNAAPSSEEPLILDLSESEPIFDSMVVFWRPEVQVGEAVAFQLSLSAPSDVSIFALPVTSLKIHFMDGLGQLAITHQAASEELASHHIQLIDVGHVHLGGEAPNEVRADLRWTTRSKVVFSGTVILEKPGTIKISSVVLGLQENGWNIEVPFDSFSLREGSVLVPKWLRSVEPIQYFPINRESCSSVVVRHQPHLLNVTMSHHAPAFLDEEYPIIIEVTNADDRNMEIHVDVLLQPTDIDHAVNHIVFGGERSTGLIKGVSFGTIASGVTALKTLNLINTGAAGDRTLDISIQSRAISNVAAPDTPPSSPDSTDAHEIADTSEALQTLIIPTVSPIAVSYSVAYRRALTQPHRLAHLNTFGNDYWDDSQGGEALITSRLEVVGPWSLEVQSIKLMRKDGVHARVIDSALDQETDQSPPVEYLPGDEFSDICRVTLAPEEDQDYAAQSIPGPGEYEVIWRRLSPNGDHPISASTSRFSLPPLEPPTEGLVALLTIPPSAKLHQPITMSLKIRNLHPSRSANVTVQLEPDTFDAFVVSGIRSGRVPILLPGGEEELVWRLIPIECGYQNVPKIKVVDLRSRVSAEVEGEGEAVNVVDLRWDRREVPAVTRKSLESASGAVVGREVSPTVLVLP
ncbi:hypothetical protein FIBSPDRAFT_917686 [Athelia psychrophila]|uniref:Trafficking protein particle complex subunit 11 n=1 Tax=Athelia psychrophila TaxID=1759441 RepID=A0A166RPV2_9AGAM|nr:hypothetical protein FIBSPDRAFT_917686 [Fibularhizoctonia sp. CBS 109695]